MMQLTQPKVAQPNPEPFGYKSPLDHWQSGTDAKQSAEQSARIPNICLYLQPDRTWDKVNDQKFEYSGDLEEGKVGHELRLEPCLTMLVIGPLYAMWAWWA